MWGAHLGGPFFFTPFFFSLFLSLYSPFLGRRFLISIQAAGNGGKVHMAGARFDRAYGLPGHMVGWGVRLVGTCGWLGNMIGRDIWLAGVREK